MAEEATPQKAKMGAPTKYNPDYCETVLIIGAEGGWLAEMAEACDVTRSTMDNWADAHPDFLEALTRAKQKAQAWFEQQGRTGLTADKFNAQLWSKQMSARHRDEYTERREFAGDPDKPIKTEEVGNGAAKVLSVLEDIAARSFND